jgi:hypothetical protein
MTNRSGDEPDDKTRDQKWKTSGDERWSWEDDWITEERRAKREVDR